MSGTAKKHSARVASHRGVRADGHVALLVSRSALAQQDAVLRAFTDNVVRPLHDARGPADLDALLARLLEQSVPTYLALVGQLATILEQYDPRAVVSATIREQTRFAGRVRRSPRLADEDRHRLEVAVRATAWIRRDVLRLRPEAAPLSDAESKQMVDAYLLEAIVVLGTPIPTKRATRSALIREFERHALAAYRVVRHRLTTVVETAVARPLSAADRALVRMSEDAASAMLAGHGASR